MKILYSTNCRNCVVLENQLIKKNIEFKVVDCPETIQKMVDDKKIFTMPSLQMEDSQIKTYTEAIKWTLAQ